MNCKHWLREVEPRVHESTPTERTRGGLAAIPVKTFVLKTLWKCCLCGEEQWLPTEPQVTFHGESKPVAAIQEERARA